MTVVRGALVVDGTGRPAAPADVSFEGGRITAVGDVGTATGDEVDGTGLALCPGFIDVHSHDDFAVILEPEMPFKVLQGVTTDVVGNCGFGAAPFAAAERSLLQSFHPGASVDPWDGFAGYMQAVDRAAPSLNVAVLVGHNTLRVELLHLDPRAPTQAEMDRMRALLTEGIEAGAVGLSTGLFYEPGTFAQTDEIVALAEAMAGTGARYTTHIRNEGPRLLESVTEAIEIGARAAVPVQISHHKANGHE